MRKIVTSAFVILISLSIWSCSPGSKKTAGIEEKLIGKWFLDSLSGPNGKFYQSDTHTKLLNFINKTDYTYEWMSGTRGNTFNGKYFILDNPNRGLKTIALIPDIMIQDSDTIRIQYLLFDLVKIEADWFQVVDETEFDGKDSLSHGFSRNYVYRRIKQATPR